MADLIYDSFPEDVASDNISLSTNTFRMMLVTSAYVPNQAAHTRRSNVTNEVTGIGYTAGGVIVPCTISRDGAVTVLTFAAASWPGSTITAPAAVIYQSTGTAANDRLVFYNDFGGNVITSGTTFNVAAGTIRLQSAVS